MSSRPTSGLELKAAFRNDPATSRCLSREAMASVNHFDSSCDVRRALRRKWFAYIRSVWDLVIWCHKPRKLQKMWSQLHKVQLLHCISGKLLAQHIYSMIHSQVCFLPIFLYFELHSQQCSYFRWSISYLQCTEKSMWAFWSSFCFGSHQNPTGAAACVYK